MTNERKKRKEREMWWKIKGKLIGREDERRNRKEKRNQGKRMKNYKKKWCGEKVRHEGRDKRTGKGEGWKRRRNKERRKKRSKWYEFFHQQHQTHHTNTRLTDTHQTFTSVEVAEFSSSNKFSSKILLTFLPFELFYFPSLLPLLTSKDK